MAENKKTNQNQITQKDKSTHVNIQESFKPVYTDESVYTNSFKPTTSKLNPSKPPPPKKA